MSKRNARKPTKSRGGKGETRDDAIIYRGPILTAAEKEARDLETVTLFEDIPTVATSGTIASVFTSDPTTGSPAGWTAWSARFREYRVLALELEFCPPAEFYFPGNGAVAGSDYPLYEVEDRASSSALASYGAAALFASLRMHPLNSRWKRRMNMSSTDEAQFGPCGNAPFAPFYIKWYADTINGGTTSTLGRARLAYVIQFRNRVA